MSKLIGVKMAPDSVNARHILISPEAAGGVAQAKTMADSLKALIDNGADFATLATQNSADPGSGAKGGDLGWFKEGQMVPAFNDACFDGEEGDLVMVESRFGYHIIEVIEQEGSTEKRAVAFIDRRVDASTKTFQDIFGAADEFARSITSMASFDQEVANRGLNKRIASNLKEGDRTIAGLENPRMMIRWAFDAKKEDVSEVFELGNSFVIGVLTAKREDGFTAIDEIKDELEAGAIKEKKAVQFVADLEAAKAGDIQTIADNANLPLEIKDGVSFSANAIQGLGREPALLGAVSGMKVSAVSAPIKGEQGVYVVYLESKSETPAQADFSNNKTILNSSLSSRVDYEVYEALKKKADITDNRSKFF
jgi:peptidyl-prolyl cis-trans isomerase D